MEWKIQESALNRFPQKNPFSCARSLTVFLFWTKRHVVFISTSLVRWSWNACQAADPRLRKKHRNGSLCHVLYHYRQSASRQLASSQIWIFSFCIRLSTIGFTRHLKKRIFVHAGRLNIRTRNRFCNGASTIFFPLHRYGIFPIWNTISENTRRANVFLDSPVHWRNFSTPTKSAAPKCWTVGKRLLDPKWTKPNPGNADFGSSWSNNLPIHIFASSARSKINLSISLPLSDTEYRNIVPSMFSAFPTFPVRF